MTNIKTNTYSLFNGDCLDIMRNIPDKSIDMILCDLPYSITQNHWDCEIPLNDYVLINNKRVKKQDYFLNKALDGLSKKEIDALWQSEKINGLWSYYNRIIKDNGIIILFSQDMFSAKLMNSNEKMYRYKLYWEKDRPSGFLNAKRMPLKNVEEILIFYKKLPPYNPQFWEGKPLHGMGKKYKIEGHLANNNYGNFPSHLNPSANRKGDTKKYPRQILRFNRPHPPIHPTQKPTDLCSWLIKSFSIDGATILDNTMGSGTVGISVLEVGENRKFIGIEQNDTYFNIAKERIENFYKSKKIEP